MVNDHKHIVFCREHYNPLSIIRSLGEAGIDVTAIIIKGGRRFVGSSKYVKEAIYVKDIEEAVTKLENQFLNEKFKPFVYITDDYFLEYFDNHYDEFKNNFYFANAGECGRVSYYMNKHNLNELAKECGIKVPRSEVVEKGNIPQNLRYPVITKAISSVSGAWKADSFICSSEKELVDAFSKIKGTTILIQEFIDRKGEFNIDGLSVDHGNSVFLSMKTELLYLIPGRYSNYMKVSNVDDMDLSRKIKKMIKEMNYEGIFDGEFMIGKDNEIYFLEINLRPNAFNYASTCAGMNVPYIWAKSMIEGYVDEGYYKPIPDGFCAMVENSDFKDRVLTRKVSIFKWLHDFNKSQCHFFFNVRDMMPFIKAFIIR